MILIPMNSKVIGHPVDVIQLEMQQFPVCLLHVFNCEYLKVFSM